MHKHLKPNLLMFLFVLPFFLICPLCVTSMFLGFPSAAIQNNARLSEYKKGFNKLDLPEDTIQVGKTHVLIGGFDIPTKEDSNACDIVSAKILKSSLKQEKLSLQLLDNYQNLFKTEGVSKYLDASELKLYPVNLDENYFSNDGFELNIDKNFKVEDNQKDLDDEESFFILYALNMNIFESRDLRCSTDDVPESSIKVDAETEDIDDNPVEEQPIVPETTTPEVPAEPIAPAI